MPAKPSCASCREPVDRLQRSRGIVAAYPCLCWLTGAQANGVAEEGRAIHAAQAERAQEMLA